VLQEYADQGRRGQFLTLTYEDAPSSLAYSDFQAFMKRFRYHEGACRFLCVGEYGEVSGRAHWHALIFGVDPKAIGRVAVSGWDAGFAVVGTITPASAGYVGGS